MKNTLPPPPSPMGQKMSAKLRMILEGKVAISYFIAYILLVLAIFQGKSVTETWRIATGSVILGLSLFVTLFVPYSSVATRASMLGKVYLLSRSLEICCVFKMHMHCQRSLRTLLIARIVSPACRFSVNVNF